MIITRFAPSPTGRLHLGHAYSAMLAHDFARERGGRFLLRIEDIDPGRCREEFVTGIEGDLNWLGLTWNGPVRRQSKHLADYAAALETLRQQGLVYPCFCTRKDIAESLTAPHPPLLGGEREGPATREGEGGRKRHLGAGAGDHPLPNPLSSREREQIYPGTCRGLADPHLTRAHAWRLDVTAALARTGALSWTDHGSVIAADPASLGDVVLARKDAPTSYHLAVTVDDALQGVTDIVRGEDLFAATHIHRLLQALLGLHTPAYHHHALLLGADGKRLAKRDKAETLESLRDAGADPAVILAGLRTRSPTPTKAS